MTSKRTVRESVLKSRGNAAQRDKSSIITEAKNLVKSLHYVQCNVTKYERREGAFALLTEAAIRLIKDFCQARACSGERRLAYIEEMIGEMGVIDAMFDECIQAGIFGDSDKLRIARHLDRMDEDIMRWQLVTKGRTQSNSQDNKVNS
jgi:hypothetical protein